MDENIEKNIFGLRWWQNRGLGWLGIVGSNGEVSGKMALGKGCEKKGTVLHEGLSRTLIYEHPDQWVNWVERGENGEGTDWSK